MVMGLIFRTKLLITHWLTRLNSVQRGKWNLCIALLTFIFILILAFRFAFIFHSSIYHSSKNCLLICHYNSNSYLCIYSFSLAWTFINKHGLQFVMSYVSTNIVQSCSGKIFSLSLSFFRFGGFIVKHRTVKPLYIIKLLLFSSLLSNHHQRLGSSLLLSL